MRYVSFEFENFRGIRKTQLDLNAAGSDARIFTLVGLNESGKTTILEAIDRFLPTQEGDDAEVSPKQLAGWVAPEPDDLVPIAERTNFNGQVVVRATIELDDADVDAVYAAVRRRTRFRVKSVLPRITITVSNIFENSRYVRTETRWPSRIGDGYKSTGTVLRSISPSEDAVVWQAAVNAIRSRLPQIWYFPNFLFEFPRRIILSPQADESEANRFYRHLFQDILDTLNKDLTVAEHLVERARSSEPSDYRNLRQLLLDVSREVTSSVVAAWTQLFESPNELGGKSVRIEPIQEPGPSGETTIGVEFLLEDSDGIFGIHERSLGFRWFFVYLLLTHYRGRRRGESGEMLFLFDEPASNLHSSAQAALLESIGRLAEKAHVIYTTHSHHLVNPAWLKSTFVVMNAGSDPSVLTADVVARRTDIRVEGLHHFAAQHPGRSHYFQPVLDVLGYAPSQLELVPSVVMVEGKTDYYLLRYFSEIAAPGTVPLLSFLPGTGAGTLLTPIQLYMAWSRDFVVLLDSDRAGTQARRRYEEQLGPLMLTRITDLAAVCGDPDVSAIESVLEHEDRLAFQALVEQSPKTYRKKALAQGIQEALASRKQVLLSEKAAARLRRAITSLAELLQSRDPS